MNFLKSSALQLLVNFLIAFATGLLVKLQNLQLIIGGELINPDSYMRLVRIQEALANGFWFTNIVRRNESGLGTLIYWSHFVDGFIFLLRFPLLALMSPEAALFWAGALLGPILLGLLGMICAWAVTPWVDRPWGVLVAITVALSPPLLNYGQIGVATHHLMIVIWVVAGWAFVSRTYLDLSPINGMLAGACSGLAIWVSPEATPYCLLGFGGVLFLNILPDSLGRIQSKYSGMVRRSSQASALYGLGFLATITFAWVIDPPFQGWLYAALDRISVTFVTLAFLIFNASLIPALCDKGSLGRVQRMTLIPCSALLAVGIWMCLFPAYLKGLNGLMSPEEASAFFITSEMSPINSVEMFFNYAFTGVISCLAMIWIALTQSVIKNRLSILYIAFGTFICVGFAFWHVRFAIYSAAISAMTFGALLTILSKPDHLKTQIQRAIALFCFMILPGLSVILYQKLVTNERLFTVQLERPASDISAIHLPANCSLRDAVRLIKPLGSAVVLTDANIGPALLFNTQVKIVGSFYHAGIKGYMRLKAAWESAEHQNIPPEVIITGSQYVLFCTSKGVQEEVNNSADPNPKISPSSLWDRLDSRRVPPWLSEVSSSTSSGWVLYQIQDNH